MRKSATNDDVLSTREAAEQLGVALRTVQLWVEAGVLPAWKTAGGHRRISRVAVQKLIAERQAALMSNDAAPPRSGLPSPLRVVLVEDEPEQLKLFTLIINGWGLNVELHATGDGFSALLHMGQHGADMLITDLNMPGMDGFKMITALRRVGQPHGDMDIVVVTALSREEIGRRGGLPDGVQVFHKPVPYDELEQLVRDRLVAMVAL